MSTIEPVTDQYVYLHDPQTPCQIAQNALYGPVWTLKSKVKAVYVDEECERWTLKNGEHILVVAREQFYAMFLGEEPVIDPFGGEKPTIIP